MGKKDETKIFKQKDIDEIDWFLQDMVDMVNTGHVKFGIVLNVKGLIISGLLIGGKDYFEGFAKDFSLLIKDSEAKERIENNLSNYGKTIYGQKEEKDDKPRKPQYIHLKNAKMYFPGEKPIPENRSVWWRGRISEIDGWIFGKLEAGQRTL